MSVRLKQFKSIAKKYELVAVDFLTYNNLVTEDYRFMIRVRYEFSNGDIFMLSKRECEALGDFKFKLGEKANKHH